MMEYKAHIRSQFTPAPGSHLSLQRKCACGGTPGLPDEREEHRRKLGAHQLARLQARLAVNQPGDVWEQEAERMAESVMAGRPATPGLAAPMRVNRDGAAPAAEVPASVQATLRSPGEPLDVATREHMSRHFGHDFSQVRVHTNGLAAESARALGADAYTVGREVVFDSGRYAPSSPGGRRLLAHELTHVIQQGASASPAGVIQRSLKTYVKAMNQNPPDWYTAALHLNGESTAIIHQMLKNLGDPQRIAKLHQAALDGAGLGACSNVALLTEADYLKVKPGEKPADRSKCKQEATPAPKQSTSQAGGAVDPLKRSAAEIMADDKYMDNHITKMEYYAAQEAHIFYDDGSKLELGLVPPYVKNPFEGVDYHTARTTHISVDTHEPGVYKYIPRGTEIHPPAGTKYREVLDQLTRTVTFKVEPKSQRIVPTQVNTRTAPIVCQMLQESEAEYEKLMDATSKGGVKVFTAIKHVLEIYSLLPAGGLARGVSTPAAPAAAAAEASESIVARLARKLAEILAKGGRVGELVAEGVRFGEVVVSRKGSSLAVEYTFIENVGRVAGEGRVMQVALEQAAVQAAKEAGVKEAQVIVHTVVNEKWMAYLESLGYTKTIVDKAGEVGFEAVWMKILPVGG